MDIDEDLRLRAAARPDSLKKLRACKTCKLVKTYDQFYTGYCENCPHKRPEVDNAGMRDEFVQRETTPDFEGYVLNVPAIMHTQHLSRRGGHASQKFALIAMQHGVNDATST